MDRYEAELRKAIELAIPIQVKFYHLVHAFRFVGATKGINQNTYYYWNPQESEYCYETDFGRQMRIKYRENKFQRYAKK